MGLNLTPPEDFLGLITSKPDLSWKLKVGFEMTYSGLFKLVSTPVLMVDKIPEEVPESSTSIQSSPQTQDQKGTQFLAVYKLTNFVDTFSQSDSDRILNRCIQFIFYL